MSENKRYHYQDFEEYCTITDTNKCPKDLNDFYNELVNEGYLEDYDGDKDVVLELAEEKYHEYLEDHCMSSKEIIDLMNTQDRLIKELYDFRLIYNALLFNEWSKHDAIEVYKSKKHSDGESCFDGEWFVVVAILPTGQITNHYHIEYWDYFQIKEYPQVKDDFDGHTSVDVLNRLKIMVMNDE